MIELLSTAEMARADKLTIERGTPGISLMEAAGRAVADAVSGKSPLGTRIAVLAGPGNNGGDGFIAARILRDRGYRVRIGLLGTADGLRGDAAEAARRYGAAPEPLTAEVISGADVIIDALFGAGLARAIEGVGADVIAAANDSGASIFAVDLPSGVNGDSGAVLGTAIEAAETVTFFRRKPGHLLYPGRSLCGAVRVADIGIRDEILNEIAPLTSANQLELWRSAYPRPYPEMHKYSRGHAVVVSGPMLRTGAARLAATAALRAGAGLVTLASPPDALTVNAAHLTAVMLMRMEDADEFADILRDERKNAVVLGPGAGVGSTTRALAATALSGDRAVVLDADALTSFADDPDMLFTLVERAGRTPVLTPHDGEFARLFPDLDGLSKLERARVAAERAHSVVVLKGPDTVIAAPNGRAAISEDLPCWLATAGSGDVLAGIVAGLLAQHMPVFEAACAAVWMHGAAAAAIGPGLISEDLAPALCDVIREKIFDH
ncbi:MAG: NAD(P)H-hydrate dehydratase [Hyphomicrobiales bacterium]|nr:NAD(P)H-hydrate dehydratase [Hyphomicrobiales bacterium]